MTQQVECLTCEDGRGFHAVRSSCVGGSRIVRVVPKQVKLGVNEGRAAVIRALIRHDCGQCAGEDGGGREGKWEAM